MTTIDASMRSVEIQGTTVPRLGFGTWQLRGRDCVEAVRDALEIGYRHIDTARIYRNETEVGRGLAASGVDRADIFLTTKIWPGDFERARLRAATEDSLRSLATEYIDLLLLHWPSDDLVLEDALGAMVALRDEGKIRHLGVSNFFDGLLRQALDLAPVFTDQVELHPHLGRPKLVELALERDFMVTAYSPLAQGKVARDGTLREIAEAHGNSTGQVALRWLLDQPNVSAIPKASSHEHRAENFEVFDFDLTAEERARIGARPEDRRRTDPWA
ncbi:MAG TPA: aldo/keto reductase [Solirubrobacteraceae bacterium]|nr:aldo/keto reductase [Solirubrobacteraceae bacterium]